MLDHGILNWIYAGVFVGAVAKFLSGGWNIGGCLGLVFGGIVGSVFAGWLWTTMIGAQMPTGSDIMAALVGAFVVLWVGTVLFPRQSL